MVHCISYCSPRRIPRALISTGPRGIETLDGNTEELDGNTEDTEELDGNTEAPDGNTEDTEALDGNTEAPDGNTEDTEELDGNTEALDGNTEALVDAMSNQNLGRHVTHDGPDGHVRHHSHVRQIREC